MPAGKVVGSVLVAVVVWSFRTHGAQAEPTADEKALATVLFQEGRALMAEGRTADACLKLEESQRLDPSGGTILNLALCHQQEGRLARSWSEFNDAAAVARKDGRQDRQLVAERYARLLAPRLSKLTVVVPVAAQADGLRIERDGWELGRGAWSTAMPVDGGEHIVRATAPGRQPFTTTIVIGKESDAHTVEIPILTPTTLLPQSPSPTRAATSPPVVSASSTSSTTPVLVQGPPSPTDSDRSSSTGPGVRRTVGWALGGAGLVQLGLASYFGWRAFDQHCANDWCGTDDQAGRAADASTVLTITGLVCAATSTYLLLRSPSGQRH